MSAGKRFDHLLHGRHDGSPVCRSAQNSWSFMPLFLARAVSGWYRLRRRLGWYYPPIYGMADLNYSESVSQSQVPSDALSKWAPLIEQLHDLQFQAVNFDYLVLWVSSSIVFASCGTSTERSWPRSNGCACRGQRLGRDGNFGAEQLHRLRPGSHDRLCRAWPLDAQRRLSIALCGQLVRLKSSAAQAKRGASPRPDGRSSRTLCRPGRYPVRSYAALETPPSMAAGPRTPTPLSPKEVTRLRARASELLKAQP